MAGIVAVALLMGGAFFGYRTIKQNRPRPIWVPIATNPELPITKRDEIIKDLKNKLSRPELLEKVSRDLSLPSKLKLANDRTTAADLANRLFVRAGDMDTPKGKVPAIHIGFTGKVKDVRITEQTTMRLMDDAWPLLGIESPKKPAP